MPKQYYIVKQISEAEYLKIAKKTGALDIATQLNNQMVAGAIKIDPETWIGVTDEVPSEEEE